MKEIEFNRDNAIKVITEFANGFIKESAANVLRSKIKGEDIDIMLYGMAKASSLFFGIFTNEDEFHDAINYLAADVDALSNAQIHQKDNYKKKHRQLKGEK